MRLASFRVVVPSKTKEPRGAFHSHTGEGETVRAAPRYAAVVVARWIRQGFVLLVERHGSHGRCSFWLSVSRCEYQASSGGREVSNSRPAAVMA